VDVAGGAAGAGTGVEPKMEWRIQLAKQVRKLFAFAAGKGQAEAAYWAMAMTAGDCRHRAEMSQLGCHMGRKRRRLTISDTECRRTGNLSSGQNETHFGRMVEKLTGER